MTLLDLLEYDDEHKKKRKDIFYNFLYGLIFVSAFFLGARLLTTSVRYEYARTQIKIMAEGRNYETLESLEESPWSSDECFFAGMFGVFLVVGGTLLPATQFFMFLPDSVRRCRDITGDEEERQEKTKKAT